MAHFPRRRGIFAGIVLALTLAALGETSGHAAPAVTAEGRRDAGRKFEEGKRAFDAGDYTRAGDAFEAAYQLAPHEDSLWDAARAWHRAGELSRAANLYARYLREAPAHAPDRGSATQALAALGAKLARFEIHLGAGITDPRLDDAAIEGSVVYALPGAHVLRANGTRGVVESRQNVAAGGAVSVVLAPSDAPASPQPALVPPPPPPSRDEPPTSPPALSVGAGWSPTVVVVEAGVALVLTGFAVWSGLKTMSTLRAFESLPTQAGLDDGRAEEVRTNVFIGASIGAAAITAFTAAFLVDWRGGARPLRVGFGPGTAALQGRF